MPDAPDPVARIDALTTNARNTWFALLGVLVFVAITLMGVEHIDFYGVDRATDLPLVNVSVPTWLFFYAAPLLVSAVYGYFHLYLIRLWDALGGTPPRLNGERLGDAIAPWLVTDAALHLRARMRKDNCVRPRAMEWPAAILNILLAWVFGLGILIWTWVESLPARSFTMTAIAAICLLASLTMAYVSLRVMWRRMARTGQTHVAQTARETALVAGLVFLAPTLIAISHGRTSGETAVLASLDLTGASLVERPDDWLPHYIARREFRATWCRREQIDACQDLGDRAGELEDEWRQRRTAERAALKQPYWSVPHPDPIDLRGANLSGSFLAGASLRRALLDKANLALAQMEAVDLDGARMAGALLHETRLEQADLRGAQLQGATLTAANLVGAKLAGTLLVSADMLGAQMQSANLFQADLSGADMRTVQLQGADLYDATLTDANLIAADLTGANLNESDMRRTRLNGTRLEQASLSGVDLRGADLNRARLTDADLDGAQLQGADLHRATMDNTSLRRANLAGTNISGSSLRNSDLSFSLIAGGESGELSTIGTDFRGSRNGGGALRNADLSLAEFDADSDWRTVFLDASVYVPDELRALFDAPCQWAGVQGRDTPLPDAEFFARWRGWVEADPTYVEWSGWPIFAPPEWRDVPPIAPPPDCAWQTDPLPDSDD